MRTACCSYLLLFLLFFGPGNGISAQPFDVALDRAEKTKVLVLGTAHLANVFENDEAFEPRSLDTLLNVLQAFHPLVVAVEKIPSNVLHYMDIDAPRYGWFVHQMWPEPRLERGKRMQHLLGVDWYEARMRADSLRRKVETASIERVERLELVQYSLAAYNHMDALLHWSYLPKSFRASVVGAQLPKSIRDHLNGRLHFRGETSSIGLRLAQRLGHATIAQIDDQQDVDIIREVFEEMSTALEQNEAYQAYRESVRQRGAVDRKKLEEAIGHGDLLPLFLHWNSPEYQQADMEQWQVLLRTHLPSKYDRRRVAQWEVRNMNSASHIRRVTAYHPGGRVLVIVGASHKPFYEAYLSQMIDLELVQLRDLVEPDGR